ncbi:MAG: 4-hydroxy-tetrahydrodipicolinate reductase [Pseudomonadota bacterium]
MTAPIKIAIAGISGRMGQSIAHEALVMSEKVSIASAFARRNSAVQGRDLGDVLKIGPIGIEVTGEPDQNRSDIDVLIDFTHPSVLPAHLEWCKNTNTALVVGTTGLSDADLEDLKAAGDKIPVLYGANMSVGINILANIVEQLSSVLDPDFDIEIVEAHHRHKKDAPSGTALLLGESAANGRSTDLKSAAVMSREGETGERRRGAIGFATIRGGDVAGEHTVLYLGDGERLELTHKASDRRIFAKGALRATLWLATQPAGFFNMKDMLGIKS